MSSVGELHAVIGPNGAGKTTLIDVLSGDLSPTAGSVLFRGREISHLAPERRSRLGMGRSYQKINIFPAFSVLENCRLAAQSRAGRARSTGCGMRCPTTRSGQCASSSFELSAWETARAVIAATLSHGEQRQLEIAMSLATDPKLLLLDEPLAGMGAEEILEHGRADRRA